MSPLPVTDGKLEPWEQRAAILTIRALGMAASADDPDLPFTGSERNQLRKLAAILRSEAHALRTRQRV